MFPLLTYLGVSPVHTTGVNIDGVLANVASITVILAALMGLMVRSIKRSLNDTITNIVKDTIASEITPKFDEIKSDMGQVKGTLSEHAISIARLEGIREGQRREGIATGSSADHGRSHQ